jgi:hypothetical protein
MKLGYMDMHDTMLSAVHGRAKKDLIVLHETVSSDIPGWKDITSVEAFLDAKGYGIHGITDLEGHIAWSHGLGDAIFWQAGGVNGRSIGIEQVSRVMLQAPTNYLRRQLWVAREKELRATAKLVAAISNTKGIPIRAATWNGSQFTSGVLTHYQVSQHYAASEGHTDCFPVHLGGYYPLYEVLQFAKGYKKLGYTL